MLLPPEFVLNHCLGLRIDVEGRRVLADIVGRGEACLRKWQRDKSFPQEAIDKLVVHFADIDNGGMAKEINAVASEPYRAESEATKWRLFCQGMLAHKDVFLETTIKEILVFSGQQIDLINEIRSLEPTERFHAYKTCLSEDFGQRFGLPSSMTRYLDQCSDWDELRPVVSWLIAETFIYFMALAEVDCLQNYYAIKESKLSVWGLPELKGKKIKYPLKVFFDQFFDRLVSGGHFSSLDQIAERMPRVLPLDKKGRAEGKSGKVLGKESGWREIKRAKYQGKPPSFESFSAWIDALIPHRGPDSFTEFEEEKKLLCDLFAAARVMDGFCRDVRKTMSEEKLLDHFHRYEMWHKFHSDKINASGGGVVPPPMP